MPAMANSLLADEGNRDSSDRGFIVTAASGDRLKQAYSDSDDDAENQNENDSRAA
jgi:hypothetical protein